MIKFNLCTFDWSAISAIVSFIMVIATFLTLYFNQKHLREERRARLNCRICTYNHAYFLEIYNSGQEDAYNINLIFNDIFLNHLPEDALECFNSTISEPFYIKSKDSIFLFIGFCEKITNEWKDKDFTIKIKGKYNNSYKIEAELPIKQFIGKIHMIVRTPVEHALEKIAEGLVKPNTIPKHRDIQYSVQIIADNLQKICSELKSEKH